jgi:heat shock protein HslJ
MARGPAWRLALVAALPVVLLGGGPVAAQEASPTPGPKTPAVEGPPWQLTEYRDGDALAPVLPGVRADITFWTGNASVSTGCAFFDNRYTLDGQAISLERFEAPAAECDPETMEVHDALLANLRQVAAWDVDGAELTLSDAAGDEQLRFTWATVPAELDISPWKLARLADEDGRLQPVVEGSVATAQFLPGGRVVGANGCGGFLGSYSGSGTNLRITDIAARVGECPPELAAQADALVAALPRAAEAEVTPTGLTLLDADGERLLSWVPDPALVGTLWTPLVITGAPSAPAGKLANAVVAFGTDVANGRTLCGRWEAAYRRSGLALTLEEPARSRKRCKPPKAEEAFVGALRDVAAFALRRGTIDLLDKDGESLMQLSPQGALTDRTWALTRIRDRAPVGTPPTMRFASDGMATGETGCGNNIFEANWSTTGAKLEIDGIIPGISRCSKGAARQEKAFLELLEERKGGANNYVVLSDKLRFYRDDQLLLEFEPPAR